MYLHDCKCLLLNSYHIYIRCQILRRPFSIKLRDETDLDALNDELVGVVRKTMAPAHVSVWLRPDTARKRERA